MGIVNLTPDSFFDGGKLMAGGSDDANVSVAQRRCEQLVAHGAELLDIGGESTRPGAESITPERERARIVPLIERLCRGPVPIGVPVSVDTRHAAVAEAALAAGAGIVNDISGLADSAMADVVAAARAGLVIGHLRGTPQTMQEGIHFVDLLNEVGDELAASIARAQAAGVERSAIMVDPGIGFGKTAEQSAALVASSSLLSQRLGVPVMIGASRKSFLSTIAPGELGERAIASVAAAMVAAMHGAAVVRVHDVRETALALAVARGVEAALAAVRRGQP